MAAHLNIIVQSNGVGLDRDANLLKEIAEGADYQVTVSHCRSISSWNRWMPARKRFDANLFLERVFPRWINSADVNLLIPNQERFPKRHLARLKKIDHILCKSRHALEIFSEHHPNCELIGFTSLNLDRSEIERKKSGIFHLAGKSSLKGTETILDRWRAHSEWPTLTLLQHKEKAPGEVPKNVQLITDYLSNEDLIRLANEYPVHLCPSLSEGWGHYIVEAMSCGAVVVTTDGPPMNELVSADRGILVPVSKDEPRHLGTNFHVDPEAFDIAINQVLTMTEGQRLAIGHEAREWAEKNSAEFSKNFVETLQSLLH